MVEPAPRAKGGKATGRAKGNSNKATYRVGPKELNMWFYFDDNVDLHVVS